MKHLFIILLCSTAFTAQSQIVTKDSLNRPLSDKKIERPEPVVVQFGLYTGLTTIEDINQRQYIGKNTLPITGAVLRFGNAEASKVLVYMAGDLYRYKYADYYDTLKGYNVLQIIRSFQLSAGLQFPIRLQQGHSLYLSPGFSLGEIQGRNLDYYRFYWGLSLGFGYEKRLMTNLRVFAEMSYNLNQAAFGFRNNHTSSNLDTFRLRCGIRF